MAATWVSQSQRKVGRRREFYLVASDGSVALAGLGIDRDGRGHYTYSAAGITAGAAARSAVPAVTNIAGMQKMLAAYLGADARAALAASPEAVMPGAAAAAEGARANERAQKRGGAAGGGSGARPRAAQHAAASGEHAVPGVPQPPPPAERAQVPPGGYDAWREQKGLTLDGRITKAYFLSAGGGRASSERLVVVGVEGARKDKHYIYTVVDDLGGLLPPLDTANNGRLVKEYLDHVLTWVPGEAMRALAPRGARAVAGVVSSLHSGGGGGSGTQAASGRGRGRARAGARAPLELDHLDAPVEGKRRRVQAQFYDPSMDEGRGAHRATVSGTREAAALAGGGTHGRAAGSGGGRSRSGTRDGGSSRARANTTAGAHPHLPQPDTSSWVAGTHVLHPGMQAWLCAPASGIADAAGAAGTGAAAVDGSELSALRSHVKVLSAMIVLDDDHVDRATLGGVSVSTVKEVKAVLQSLLNAPRVPTLATFEASGIARPVAALRTHPGPGIAALAEALSRRWATAVDEVASAIMREPAKLLTGHCFEPAQEQRGVRWDPYA